MPQPERSLGELITDLTQSLRTLLRQEIALARAELTQNVTSARRGAIMVVAGGAVAYAGLLVVLAGLCVALIALGLHPVLAVFIVGVAVVVIGLLVVRAGVAALSPDRIAPKATVESLKDNAQALRGQQK